MTMARWVEEEGKRRVVQGVVPLVVMVVVEVGACCRRFAIFVTYATVGSPRIEQSSLLRCPVAAFEAEEYAPLPPRRPLREAHPFHEQC
jgi:hypothetical protein